MGVNSPARRAFHALCIRWRRFNAVVRRLWHLWAGPKENSSCQRASTRAGSGSLPRNVFEVYAREISGMRMASLWRFSIADAAASSGKNLGAEIGMAIRRARLDQTRLLKSI